jgi:hypothetical protein
VTSDWLVHSGASGPLREVVGLARLLIRNEVRCTNLVSKVLSLALGRLPEDWQARYGMRPQLVETYVDRSHFTGLCFSAANWVRVGVSTGRGRLGPKTAVKSLKDVWVFPLERRTRQTLQSEVPPPLTPQPLEQIWRGKLVRLRDGGAGLRRPTPRATRPQDPSSALEAAPSQLLRQF